MVLVDMKKILSKILLIRFFRFALMGGCSTCMDFTLYMCLSTRMSVIISKLISMSVSSVFSFAVNKRFTFKNSSKTNFMCVIRFYSVFVVNVVVNVCINSFVFYWTELKVLSYIIATGCGLIINYLLQSFLVFKIDKEDMKDK